MDLDTARHLGDITAEFYQRTSASFSATRQSAWPGWRRVLRAASFGAGQSVSVLDLACGNLRFERFLVEQGLCVRAWAIDACDELELLGAAAGQAGEVAYQHLDIAGLLLDGDDLGGAIDVPPCDIAVSFGFMHHLPLESQRQLLLRALVSHVHPEGLIAVSFWQFAKSPRLMAKAVPVPHGDAGDYLLGWQDRTDVQRYCHSFREDEIDALATACLPWACEVGRFSADGARGDLNRYLLLRRTGECP